MKKILGAFLLAPLFHMMPATAAPQSALGAYTQCPLSGNLSAVSSVRGAVMPRKRSVETEAGPQEISVADGYKVMLAFPNTGDFVNLKVERSVPGQYAADKKTVLAQMQLMVKRAPANMAGIEHGTDKGIEIMALNNSALAGGIIGFYTLFDDRQEVIATAYLLNHDPKRRAFQTFDEYKALRDGFIRDFTACMATFNQVQ